MTSFVVLALPLLTYATKKEMHMLFRDLKSWVVNSEVGAHRTDPIGEHWFTLTKRHTGVWVECTFRGETSDIVCATTYRELCVAIVEWRYDYYAEIGDSAMRKANAERETTLNRLGYYANDPLTWKLEVEPVKYDAPRVDYDKKIV